MNPIYRALTLSLAFFLVFSIKTFSYDISFSVDVDSGCVPLTVTFTNTSSDTAGRSFEWDFGDGEWGEGFEVTHTYKNAGFFNPQLHDWSCCSSGPREIRVSGADTFNISTGLEACPNEKITFTAYNGDYNWIKWDFGDGESETWNNVSHKYQTPGQYNITLLYNSNECGLDSVT